MKILDETDLHFFENDFISIITEFIQSLVKPVVGGINQNIFDFYLDFTRPSFIDEIEEEEEKNPERLY